MHFQLTFGKAQIAGYNPSSKAMDISDSVLDSVEDIAMEVSDQNICEEAAYWQVDIKSEEASINYKGAGAYVDKVENDINWEKYHELFSPELKGHIHLK